MSFLEPGGKVSVVKDGKTVEEIDIETEVTLINTKTNQEYNSDQEAQDDVNNPGTETKQEDLSRSVRIKVAKMPDILTDSSS
ncbi:MAG: hypothetical protein CML57_00145 [Rhodobacteraceae bacterium]|nr:hypothetical protein [Paracoccaceae bacterium]|tara:strand:- start:257 stop:502 length:246 start_codon:yes stop_codon:yes gene_type:complete